MGKVEGEIIRCPYHGFEYNQQGRCTLVPSQSTIVPQLAVRSFPLVEVGPYIWIWPGEGEGDMSLLPDQTAIGITRPGWRITPFFMMEMECNFEILHENLLDTSHISFLHAGLIDSGPIAEAKFKISQTETTVRISRDVIERPTPAMAATFHLEPGKAVQRTLITEAIAPNLSVITNIFTFPDQPDRPAHILISPQGVTPANDRKCLNFLVLSSSYQDEQPAEAVPALWHLFGQDQAVLGQVQRRFDEEGGWDLPEISVRADSAALNFRRKMAAMVEEERAARSLVRAGTERAA
jgi:vanillate O-demethylase monooxygenase subunit